MPSYRSEIADAFVLSSNAEFVAVAVGGETNCFASALIPTPVSNEEDLSEEYLVVCPQYKDSDTCNVNDCFLYELNVAQR